MIEAEFPDASLGVYEPNNIYAQVLTPRYSTSLFPMARSTSAPLAARIQYMCAGLGAAWALRHLE